MAHALAFARTMAALGLVERDGHFTTKPRTPDAPNLLMLAAIARRVREALSEVFDVPELAWIKHRDEPTCFAFTANAKLSITIEAGNCTVTVEQELLG